MALTAANIIKVAQIVGTTPLEIDAQLAYMGAVFTSTKQTEVEAQIALWTAGAGTKTTKLHPKESNKGVETNPDKARADIRRNIALVLERTDWAESGNGSMKLQRG